MKLGEQVAAWFSSSTCFEIGPLVQFYGPDAFLLDDRIYQVPVTNQQQQRPFYGPLPGLPG